jgi:CHAD domain-containing protein
MSRPRQSPAKGASSPRSTASTRRYRGTRLDVNQSCDSAFRILAKRYLQKLAANHEPTCQGKPAALHEMRIVLTYLRTTILFFSPMVEDSARAKIRDELKWLNSQLGALRDLDVAIDRIRALARERARPIPQLKAWRDTRAVALERLARALRSARYRRLVVRTLRWIEAGPWSKKRGGAAAARAVPLATYGIDKLGKWEARLLKKSRKLRDMDAEQRHRLRLLNKKLNYAIDSLADVFDDKRFSKQMAARKHLRKAQRCLGQLNDDVRGHALAMALRKDGIETPLQFLGPGREKRLLKTTEAAYRKLEALKLFRK